MLAMVRRFRIHDCCFYFLVCSHFRRSLKRRCWLRLDGSSCERVVPLWLLFLRAFFLLFSVFVFLPSNFFIIFFSLILPHPLSPSSSLFSFSSFSFSLFYSLFPLYFFSISERETWLSKRLSLEAQELVTWPQCCAQELVTWPKCCAHALTTL